MAVIAQYKGEVDDTPWNASGISPNSFGTIQNSGRTPPRLYLRQGTGEAKSWSFPSKAELSFRAYVQFKTYPSTFNNIFSFRPGIRVDIQQFGSALRLIRNNVTISTSPINLPFTRDLLVRAIITQTFYSWEVKDAETYESYYSNEGGWAAPGPFTLFHSSFNFDSDIYLDNIELNDDVSKFIDAVPLPPKSQGQPLYDYGDYD